VSTTADRCAKLCRAYSQLAEQFQKLDVEYMTLKSKLPDVLKAVQTYKRAIATLKQEKADLEAKLQEVSDKYETLKPFEDLLQPEFEAELAEAEEQASLVEQTIQELESNPDPDLSDAEKQLLYEFQQETHQFLSVDANGYHGSSEDLHSGYNAQSAAML
jgi:chromosome segregation ATPase